MKETVAILSNFTFFFFNDTATTEIYTLSLHDALPILWRSEAREAIAALALRWEVGGTSGSPDRIVGEESFDTLRRSEEHTSELQSPCNLVCRLLLEKKKNFQLLRCSKSLPRVTPWSTS